MELNGEEIIALTFNKNTGATNRFGTDAGLAFAHRRCDFETSFLESVSGEYYSEQIIGMPQLF